MGKFILKQNGNGLTFAFIKDQKILMQSCRTYLDRDDCLNCLRSLFLKLAPSSIEDRTLEEAARLSNPKFEILFHATDGYCFRITDHDGNIFATSRPWASKLECINAIDDVIKTLYPIL